MEYVNSERISRQKPRLRWSRKIGQVAKLGSVLKKDELDGAGKRKRYAAEFKAKVALEALRGELTTAQLATKHGVHQTVISEWKRQAVAGLASVFSGKSEAKEIAREGEVEKLHAKIGQLLVERDFLAKAFGR
jgi:transposase